MQISKELHTTMSRPFYSDGKKAKMCRSSASSSSLSHFFPRDFSGAIADSDKYTAKTVLPADVPFGGFVDIAPHFWNKIPRKPPFWGRE